MNMILLVLLHQCHFHHWTNCFLIDTLLAINLMLRFLKALIQWFVYIHSKQNSNLTEISADLTMTTLEITGSGEIVVKNRCTGGTNDIDHHRTFIENKKTKFLYCWIAKLYQYSLDALQSWLNLI
ncbi:hypothetical protein DICVIV_09022 [Dictyocaulus viviparus]|uniref:Uncharacterized protein n=1 Tax=Dictyocaulus viviparus TaxID=29172 RepID=A0A0D8XRC9_DICVI|nr:hypothetical protein DICVIV_09022 [Dictyocaulus viviparus]